MRSVVFIVFALSLVVAMLNTGCSEPKPPGMLPAVAAFLDEHPEFGKAAEVEQMPDWAQGQRQGVITTGDGGRKSLLFYLKGEAVQTVYQQDATGRRKVWGDYDRP